MKSVNKITRGLPEELVDSLLEAVGSLVRPGYLKSRGLDEAKCYGGYGRGPSLGYRGGAAPPGLYVYSPGFQAAPPTAPDWYAIGQAAGVPPLVWTGSSALGLHYGAMESN